ncbi:MAG: acyltransferase domain-containing protein, partial [Kiritimatiellia bacterium]|nr:acyltransferase domain-containing protein [Kiritimatiellia bacterium]
MSETADPLEVRIDLPPFSPRGVADSLGIPALEEKITPQWEAALTARSSAVILPILDPAQIRLRREAFGLSPACDAPLQAVAQLIRERPALEAVAWYLHWRIFCSPEPGPLAEPPLDACLGDLTGAFFLLVALEFKPALTVLHRRRGYSQEVTDESLSQVQGYIENYRKGTGRIGCYGSQVCWLRTYFAFPYVRLGRFSYQLKSYAGVVRAWRRRNGDMMALAREGLRIDSEGLIARADEVADWTTYLLEKDDSVTGNPVDPAGRILPGTVSLQRSEWSPFLMPGDSILSIHIPPGGGMDPDRVRESLQRARIFFARHHPEQPIRVFWCATWFLDPRLASLLPPTANPLRFQRCLYLHPIESSRDGGLWFVFLRSTDDLAGLPRETSLQRALAGFL